MVTLVQLAEQPSVIRRVTGSSPVRHPASCVNLSNFVENAIKNKFPASVSAAAGRNQRPKPKVAATVGFCSPTSVEVGNWEKVSHFADRVRVEHEVHNRNGFTRSSGIRGGSQSVVPRTESCQAFSFFMATRATCARAAGVVPAEALRVCVRLRFTSLL
jgi:hypothetical protein